MTSWKANLDTDYAAVDASPTEDVATVTPFRMPPGELEHRGPRRRPDHVRPHRHRPFAALDADAAARTTTATSATKTFNLAGLRCAVAHVGHQVVLDRIDQKPLDYFGEANIVGRVATVSAWNESSQWHRDMMMHLQRNRDVVTDWAATSEFHLGHLPLPPQRRPT